MHVPSRIMDDIECGICYVIEVRSAMWDCKPDTPLYAGDVVQRFTGVTYGCISPDGVACVRNHEGPFFEVPKWAISRLTFEEVK